MILQLLFDANISYVFIPDGFIVDLNLLEKNFLEWVQAQPDCIIKVTKTGYGLSFSENDFLRYLNTAILDTYNEKAFMVTNPVKKISGVLKF